MTFSTAGYVLVGGQSSRFGKDKALAEWQGQPLALRIADRVRSAAGSATLVGSPERYAVLGLPVIPDQVKGFGPLGGVLAALDHSRAQWNLVTACDLPNVSIEFLQHLLHLAAGVQADIVMPQDQEGRDEPLCSVYHSRCRAALEAAIRRGVHKVTDAFTGLQVRRLSHHEFQQFDPDGRLFANVNSPQDLDTAVRLHG